MCALIAGSRLPSRSNFFFSSNVAKPIWNGVGKKKRRKLLLLFLSKRNWNWERGLPAEFCRALISFSRKPNNLITTTAEADISDINDDDNDTNYGKDKDDDDYKRSGAYWDMTAICLPSTRPKPKPHLFRSRDNKPCQSWWGCCWCTMWQRWCWWWMFLIFPRLKGLCQRQRND